MVRAAARLCVCLCKNPGLQLELLLCRDGSGLFSSAVIALGFFPAHFSAMRIILIGCFCLFFYSLAGF